MTINLIKQRFLKYKVFDVEGSLRGTFTLLIGGIIFMILLNKRILAINSTFLRIEDSFTIVEQSMVPEMAYVAVFFSFAKLKFLRSEASQMMLFD